jgi:alanine racemase
LFGVATVDEAIELHEAGVKTGILILSPILETEVPAVARYGFAITLSSADFADAVARCALPQPLDVHVEVDTGMGRTGIAEGDAYDEILRVARCPAVSLKGVYTHFPVSDTDVDYTLAQVTRFQQLVARLRDAGVVIPFVHSANSAAVDGVVASHMDLVRPGLLAYGLHPAGVAPGIDVAPIMGWKSRLVSVRRVPAGSTISYARSFTTQRDSVIGVVPVGYGHGYPLRLSGRGSMLVSGRRVPIVGRVTMDMTMVDLTDLPAVPRDGDDVVLVGKQGDELISFHDVAGWADTICYEVMCMISKRVPRTYFRRGKVETFKTLRGVLPNHVAV